MTKYSELILIYFKEKSKMLFVDIKASLKFMNQINIKIDISFD